MEFQQMRYVVAVAEEQSFTRAAKRCHVVQSALSHQIKALERELGAVLFARTSRRVELTAAGEAFLTGARVSLDAAERAVADAAGATGEIRGSLTVGVIPTVTAIDLPAVLGGFHRTHPAVRIGLRGGTSDDFLDAIMNSRLDIAVLGLADSTQAAGVATHVLARERLVAVVSAAHPLAARRRLRLKDLAGEEFVDFPQHGSGRAQSDIAFEAAGVHREVTFEAGSVEFMLGLVKQNLAVALLPPAVVPETGDLAKIAVTDGPTRIEYLAWSDFNPAPAVRAFLDAAALPRERGQTGT